jgi:hypothetical protein
MNECQVWWTITGNFGNMMPIDWSKSTTRAKQLPTLNLVTPLTFSMKSTLMQTNIKLCSSVLQSLRQTSNQADLQIDASAVQVFQMMKRCQVWRRRTTLWQLILICTASFSHQIHKSMRYSFALGFILGL